MIRRIKVRNFLSLKEVDLDLGLRSLLIGPNMSGKSNLFACLRFLSTALGSPDPSGTSGFQRAIFSLGGFGEVAWKGADDPMIQIGVTIEIPRASSEPPKTYDYQVSLMGSFHNSNLLVESESLTVAIDSDRQCIFEVKGGSGRWTLNGKTTELNVSYSDRSILEFIGLPEFEGTAFRSLLATWRFYNLVPALMRRKPPDARKVSSGTWRELLSLADDPANIPGCVCPIEAGRLRRVAEPIGSAHSTDSNGCRNCQQPGKSSPAIGWDSADVRW
jgi:predicted ATPase